MTALLATLKIKIQKGKFSFIRQIQHIIYYQYQFVKHDCSFIFTLGKQIEVRQCLANHRNSANRTFLEQLLCVKLALFKIHIQIQHESIYHIIFLFHI